MAHLRLVSSGLDRITAGRQGDAPAVGLAKTLEDFGFQLGRLKTGTPPRLALDSVNFQGLIRQEPDDPPTPFSFLNETVAMPQTDKFCYQTFTNEHTHQVIRDTLHLNHHVREEVNGPRYCPSVESKVIRFADKKRHLIWLEPEGLHSVGSVKRGFARGKRVMSCSSMSNLY